MTGSQRGGAHARRIRAPETPLTSLSHAARKAMAGVAYRATQAAELEPEAYELMMDFQRFFDAAKNWSDEAHANHVVDRLVLASGPREGLLKIAPTENCGREHMKRFVQQRIATEHQAPFSALMNRWRGLIARQAKAEAQIRKEENATRGR